MTEEQKKKYEELVGLIGKNPVESENPVEYENPVESENSVECGNPVELCEPQLGDDKIDSSDEPWCVTFVDPSKFTEDSNYST